MTPQKRLTFSAVIPCHNAGAQLATTIDSLLAQTVPFDEIVVVDDGSTDNSTEVANAYGARVRLVTQPHKGAAVARHTGVMVSRFDVVVFCDAGDKSLPTRLALFVEAFEREPSAIAATAEACALLADNSPGPVIPPVRFQEQFTLIPTPLDHYIQSTTPLARAMNIAIKREFATMCTKVDSFYKASNDFILQIQTAQLGPFVHIGEGTITYRPTPGGITSRFGFRRQIAYSLVATLAKLPSPVPPSMMDSLINRISYEWLDATRQMLVMGEPRAALLVVWSCLRYLPIKRAVQSIWWTLKPKQQHRQ